MKTINIIFDLDGCLINSANVQKKAYFESYKEVVGDDLCPPYEEYIKYTGDSIDNVISKMGLPSKMADAYRRISCESIQLIEINWEAIDYIRQLKRMGSKVAICTGKDHYRVSQIFSYYEISNLFDVIIGGDDVVNPKPSPSPVLLAIDRLNVSKEECIMVGDGEYDIVSAKCAGILAIQSGWYENNYFGTKPDYRVSSVDELKEVIKRILS